MSDPLKTFLQWLEDAKKNPSIKEPTAMCVSTVDASGLPRARMLLLKGADERGFVFYTNLESAKGLDLRAKPFAELCFYWNPPGRQVRVRGPVRPVTDAEADAYFESRAYWSKIGAWASRQSRPLGAYAELERAVAATALKHPLGKVPRPPHWSGFRLEPESIELWEELPFRLHRRVLHTKNTSGGWDAQPLFP
ncbi:MAG: pyridoxamine 5'-phosphate oxidase [Opitutaceae bacterium]|nr:pyridoxamine 5'-phosphate oxidase [Opitutaceae bacterium]